jgi:hypothetical protein
MFKVEQLATFDCKALFFLLLWSFGYRSTCCTCIYSWLMDTAPLSSFCAVSPAEHTGRRYARPRGEVSRTRTQRTSLLLFSRFASVSYLVHLLVSATTGWLCWNMESIHYSWLVGWLCLNRKLSRAHDSRPVAFDRFPRVGCCGQH